MKQSFTEQLNTVKEAAQQAIAQIAIQKTHLILFSAAKGEADEWDVDIYDMPDFPFYDKYNCAEYAAVKEIHFQQEGIEITGILKGDSYGQEAKVLLTELDDYSSAALADYLLSTNSGAIL